MLKPGVIQSLPVLPGPVLTVYLDTDQARLTEGPSQVSLRLSGLLKQFHRMSKNSSKNNCSEPGPIWTDSYRGAGAS